MVKGKSKKAKATNWKSIIIFLLFVGFGIGTLWVYQVYKKVYKPNVAVESNDKVYLYIPTGSEYEDVVKTLWENKYIRDTVSFNWLSKKMEYPERIKPGKYQIKSSMSNRELISMLRAGRQTPVKLVFNNIRTFPQLASAISKQIEADSISLIRFFNDPAEAENFGFTHKTFISMFIPNTYEMYWNTSAKLFCEKMQKEYKRFWNENRLKKASNIEYTPEEVIILASIVEEETQNNAEKPTIAGVYINRIKKGMPLQADPTVKFAVGDFAIKRVLDKHTSIDSPYNTYRYEGLPPGPICIPSITTVNAVLNYQRHDYLYFCAKTDFSGTHSFAKTLEQHNRNANAYRKALNKLRIYK